MSEIFHDIQQYRNCEGYPVLKSPLEEPNMGYINFDCPMCYHSNVYWFKTATSQDNKRVDYHAHCNCCGYQAPVMDIYYFTCSMCGEIKCQWKTPDDNKCCICHHDEEYLKYTEICKYCFPLYINNTRMNLRDSQRDFNRRHEE